MHRDLLGRRTGAALALMTTLSVVATVHAVDFRSIDGLGNNVNNPTWGSAGIEFLRLFEPAYEDGNSVPRAGNPSSLLSARAISNFVCDQSSSVPNSRGVSDWFWQWGQFLDHDLDLTPTSSPPEPYYVPVPTGDPSFDPASTGTQEIALNRSRGVMSGGVRAQINDVTAYVDASQIYGSNATRVAALRTDNGMLTTSIADNGEVLPMYNTVGLPNDGGTGSNLFLAGDVRANEQVGLLAVHTLFIREHNRIATDLKVRLDVADTVMVAMRDAGIAEPSNNIYSENDFIYESARKLVGAQIQKTTYVEFLPLLLGALPGGRNNYDPNVNASISNEFATAAFRFGHTMLSPELKRVAPNGTPAPEGNIALAEAFFRPEQVQMYGADSLLSGLASQPAQEVDTLLVNDVRNFLFGAPGSGGFDLASLNIQRGRDHGLPSYVDVVDDLGLGSITSFDDLRPNALGLMDDIVVDLIDATYESVDDVDLWIGGLAELHANGGMVGETFTRIITDQFVRSRDGDRFFYTNILDDLRVLDPNFESTVLSDIILRNSSIGSIQTNVFLVPEPSSLILSLVSLLGCLGMVGSRREAVC